MDYQDIIKLQEQSIVYSTGNNSYRCMASFYDNDSEAQKKICQNNQNMKDHCQQNYQNYRDEYTSQQVIDYVQKYMDIIDIPLQDILMHIDQMQIAQGLNKVLLRKKILKRKNILKRYRAKNRQPKIIFNGLNFNYIPMPQQNGGDDQSQIKKKRNRVSAQISRDKKKQYFKELQDRNNKLESQMIRTKLENQQLKKSIIQQNNKNFIQKSNQIKNSIKIQQNDKKNNLFEQSLNNKLTRLLIFLGILCLIGMLKDTFFNVGEGLSKFSTAQKINQIQQNGDYNHIDQFKLLQQGQLKVAEFLQEQVSEKQASMRAQNQIKKPTLFKMVDLESKQQIVSKRFQFFSNLITRLENMKDQISNKSF